MNPERVLRSGNVESQTQHGQWPGSNNMISRLGRTCALVGLVGAALLVWASVGAPWVMADQVPIAVTGFNSDVVTVASPNPMPVVRFDSGAAAWFQAGLAGHNDGLPVSGTIVND